jgi:predicted metalloprotease with PDZ domain
VAPVATETRETAREIRQETRQNIQATRAADMGVWFNSQSNNGLVIADLANNSVFSNAGFREGDQLVSVNGRPITTEAQFVQYLTGTNLGTQPVNVIVVRNGQQQTLVLQPSALTQDIVNHDPYYQYGMIIDDRNPNQILVQRVYPRTPAYYAGLRQGDVITMLAGQQIANLNAFTQGLTQANAAIPLQITRAGQTRSIQLDPVGVSDNSVRTALRPNVDANASGNPAPPVRTPDSATVPTRIPDSAPPRATPAIPATPATPAAPRVAPESPATPATPATPAVPRVAPANPATPPAPAPQTQPGKSGGAAPGKAPAAGAGTGGASAPR